MLFLLIKFKRSYLMVVRMLGHIQSLKWLIKAQDSPRLFSI